MDRKIDLKLCISPASSEVTVSEEDGLTSEDNVTGEYAEKVEAMMSTALMQQEDIWNLLMLSCTSDAHHTCSSGGSCCCCCCCCCLSPEFFFTIKGKLENSISWCALAQSRLKRVISADPKRVTPSLQRYRPRVVDESELLS